MTPPVQRGRMAGRKKLARRCWKHPGPWRHLKGSGDANRLYYSQTRSRQEAGLLHFKGYERRQSWREPPIGRRNRTERPSTPASRTRAKTQRTRHRGQDLHLRADLRHGDPLPAQGADHRRPDIGYPINTKKSGTHGGLRLTTDHEAQCGSNPRGWACTYRIANFSLGGFPLNPYSPFGSNK